MLHFPPPPKSAYIYIYIWLLALNNKLIWKTPHLFNTVKSALRAGLYVMRNSWLLLKKASLRQVLQPPLPSHNWLAACGRDRKHITPMMPGHNVKFCYTLWRGKEGGREGKEEGETVFSGGLVFLIACGSAFVLWSWVKWVLKSPAQLVDNTQKFVLDWSSSHLTCKQNVGTAPSLFCVLQNTKSAI